MCYVVSVHVTPPAETLPSRRRTSQNGDVQARLRELEDEVSDLRAELERSERRVAAMKQIQRTLGSNLEPDRLLREIVVRTTELLEADRSTLFLIDPAADQLVSKVLEGDELREIRMPRGVGIAGWVADKGKPVHIRDAYNDERFNPEFDKRSGYRTRCMLCWPVRRPRDKQVIGAIQVLNKLDGTFENTDERLLEAIATSVGVAVDVMVLYKEAVDRNEELERARQKLELLFDTERAINQAVELDEMLEVILETALQRLNGRSAIVYLADNRADRFDVRATAGSYKAALRKLEASVSDEVLGQVVRTGEPFISNEAVDVARSRAKVRRVMAAPIRTRQGEILGVLELLNRKDNRDFSSGDLRTLTSVAGQAGRAIFARRARARKERASRLEAIGKMLSGVVHDLKTPMTLINGYTQLMVGSGEVKDREGYARDIYKQVDLMTSMTKDLLGFARGDQSLLVRKVFVQRFMAEMGDYLSREMGAVGVELNVEVGYTGAARFDETKLRRVFHNIARNAAEAMPGGGRFTVSVKKHREALVFTFSDDGPGIPKDIEARLFEAFTTSGKAGGTGLGLAMVKKIAEEHRGSVTCKSSGKGTTFRFKIPLGL